ncbi:cysteine-rich receptor-like protein kinase 42 [Neltuma alba]|uniref:cysteine-rich receptor-like protein kinase 42 n=1 Tax=Neltuma alba TaxID=207710 RepID=UPI0010A50F50|nr:cysteine-rich receptor-like protein kinase 42 [Prosopis alba]
MAVESDIFKNEFDQDRNHVGIVTGSIINPVTTQSLNSLEIKLKSGQAIQVKIEHDGLINMLYVFLGYSESQLKIVLNLTIDLPNIVPSTTYVGFTDSRGNSEREYFAKIHTIGKLRHNKILQLLGFGIKADIFLVYKYMQNGGLDCFTGSPGYLAPEVGFTWKATPESNVYSFGMVVLEVICGIRSKSKIGDKSLADYVWNMHSVNALNECVDALLGREFDEEEARMVLMVGLVCFHSDLAFRPKMRKKVHILLDPNKPLMELPEVRPLRVYASVSSSTSTSNFESRGVYSYSQLQ